MKKNELLNGLELFFLEDVFDLKEHPNKNIRDMMEKRKKTSFDFRKIEDPLKIELKHYLSHVLSLKTKVLFEIYISPLQHLITFFGDSKIKSLHEFNMELENEFRDYLESINVAISHTINRKSVSLRIMKRAYLFCIDLNSGKNVFEKEIWKLSEMGIDQQRFDQSNRRKTFNFHNIPNSVNKRFVKEYIRYIVTTTDRAISTVYTSLRYIKSFVSFLDNKELANISRNDVEEYKEMLNKKGLKNSSYNSEIIENMKFIEYLIVKGYVSINHFYINDVKKNRYEHISKMVDDYVIKQIFSVLDKIPFQESCMFLLLYSTGMRVGEVCIIKKDSFFKNQKGYFIRFYSQKMRKEVVNPVPQSLYDLLSKQRELINERYGSKSKFLFTNNSVENYRSGNYREKMQDWFKELGIKNTDGTIYQFRPHDYRHTLATTMVMNDVPFFVVQKILHHDSPEMTLSYIDLEDQRQIKRHKEFINIRGESIVFCKQKIQRNAEENTERRQSII